MLGNLKKGNVGNHGLLERSLVDQALGLSPKPTDVSVVEDARVLAAKLLDIALRKIRVIEDGVVLAVYVEVFSVDELLEPMPRAFRVQAGMTLGILEGQAGLQHLEYLWVDARRLVDVAELHGGALELAFLGGLLGS